MSRKLRRVNEQRAAWQIPSVHSGAPSRTGKNRHPAVVFLQRQLRMPVASIVSPGGMIACPVAQYDAAAESAQTRAWRPEMGAADSRCPARPK